MEGNWILGSCDSEDSNIFGRKGSVPLRKYLSYILNCIKNCSLRIDHNSQNNHQLKVNSAFLPVDSQPPLRRPPTTGECQGEIENRQATTIASMLFPLSNNQMYSISVGILGVRQTVFMYFFKLVDTPVY